MEEGDEQSKKRKDILKIYQDKELSNQEKQYKINLIMNPNLVKSIKKIDDIEKKGIDIEIKSCKHYNRNCMIQSPCCKKWYSCRLCHDDDNDHKLERQKIENIICKSCKTIQKASNKCINPDCSIEFAEYYCSICKLWKDNSTPAYHCPDCNICRIGKGIGIDRIHCHKCNICIDKDKYDTHECFTGSLDSNCPVCQKYMWDSTDPVVYMKCGHNIHDKCLKELVKTSYQCPLCKKSIHNDMKPIWEQIDNMLENTQMPEEYDKWTSEILCNDCGEKSTAKFHFIYHACQKENCGSYNTSIVEVNK